MLLFGGVEINPCPADSGLFRLGVLNSLLAILKATLMHDWRLGILPVWKCGYLLISRRV